jgi:hypothetical protein
LIKKLACHNISLLVDLDEPLGDTLTDGGLVKTPAVSNYSLTANRIVRRLFMAVPRSLSMDTVKIVIRKAENDQWLTFYNSTIFRGAVRSFFHAGKEAPILCGYAGRKYRP